MSVYKGMNKGDVYTVVYIPHHLYPFYSAIKINEKMPLVATWEDLESIKQNEVSHTEKDNYHMILLICGI